jgi:hypothetical protein
VIKIEPKEMKMFYRAMLIISMAQKTQLVETRTILVETKIL